MTHDIVTILAQCIRAFLNLSHCLRAPLRSTVMSSKTGGKKALTGTDLIHADDHVSPGLDVAPSISVSTSAYHHPCEQS